MPLGHGCISMLPWEIYVCNVSVQLALASKTALCAQNVCDCWCVYQYDALRFNHKVTPCRNVTSNQHVVQKQHVSCTTSAIQALLGLWAPHKKKSTFFGSAKRDDKKRKIHPSLHPSSRTSRALHFFFLWIRILESWNYMLQNFDWAVRQFERQHYILRCFYVVGVALPLNFDFQMQPCKDIFVYLFNYLLLISISFPDLLINLKKQQKKI